MSHEIEIDEAGKAAMFYVGETPWHGLGTKKEGVLTAGEALEAAGLNWQVETQPVFYHNGDRYAEIPDRFANVRSTDQKVLGVVGRDYKPIQNADAFTFFDGIVDSGEAKYETAGSLFGGKKVWMTAQVGDTMEVCGEAHKIFLLLSTTHDGSRALTAATTFTRVVCNNTETMAIAGAKTKWSITHKSTLEGRTGEARKALEMTFKATDAFEKEVEKLMAISVSVDQFQALITADNFLPAQKLQKAKNVAALMATFENESTIIDTDAKGTAWGAYNAITHWLDHTKSVRSAEARMISLTDGFGAKLRDKTHKRLLALV